MAIKDTDRKARENYKKKVKTVRVELYGTDEDIKEHLERVIENGGSIQGYIKDLIRADATSKKEEPQDSVYLIFTDSMDDACTIVGCCTSEKEADEYCEKHQDEYFNELTWELIEKL